MIDTGIGVYNNGGRDILLLLPRERGYFFTDDFKTRHLRRLYEHDTKYVTMVAPKELLQWQE